MQLYMGHRLYCMVFDSPKRLDILLKSACKWLYCAI